MLANGLTFNSPTSRNILLKSYLSSKSVLSESSSSDEDSDENLPSSFGSDDSVNDTTIWHHQLAKSLISMHNDIHMIITKFDKFSGKNVEINAQHKRIKYELMRMAVLLNPSELPTFHDNKSIGSYADLKQIHEKFIENQDYKHEKLRLRICQIITKLKHGMGKLQAVLFSSFDENQSLQYVHKYRKQMANSLLDIREYLIEHNRTCQSSNEEKHDEDELTKHKKTVNRAHVEMITRNPLIDQRLIDYKHKLQSFKSERSYELITSPVTSMQSKFYERLSSTGQSKDDDLSPVQLTNFPDLFREASDFFEAEFLPT